MLSVCHEDIPMLDYANNTMEPPASSIQDTDNESLLRSRGSSYHSTPVNTVDETQKSAQRRVSWHKKPTYMVLFAVLGLTLAVTHHVYYSSLSGNQATTNFQKQFVVTLENLIAFAVVSSFLAATCAAYPQYFWMSVRKKAFTLRTLDKMFALTSDPMGFISIEMYRHAPVMAVIAVLYWTMSLTAILPPGTLIIVNGLLAKTSNASMHLIDWSVVKAFQEDDVSTTPGTVVINIGSKSAESSDIVPIGGPAPNSSYSLNITGHYVQYFLAQSNLFTSTSWMTHHQNATTLSDSLVSPWPSMIYLSAFDPWVHPGKDGSGWLEGSELDTSFPDQFNNWDVSIRRNILSDLSNTNSTFFMVQPKLWVLTASDRFVCGLVNGTRKVHFDFIDNTQHIKYGELLNTTDVRMLWTNVPVFSGSIGNTRSPQFAPYVSLYQSMISMLSGNIKAQIGTSEMDSLALNTVRFGLPSRVLSTGLAGCDDFLDAYWNDNPLVVNGDCLLSVSGTVGSCAWQNAYQAFNISRSTNIYNSSEFFYKTVLGMSKQNATAIPVTFTHSTNLFSYSPQYLFLSYGIAFFFTILSTALGLYAFYANGVIHSTALSAIIATTRNPDLENIAGSHSLRDTQLGRDIRDVKLQLGVLRGNRPENERVALGRAEDVRGLEKGDLYF